MDDWCQHHYPIPLVLMQVNNVLGTCRQLMQLLILYLQLSQTTITELGLLLSRHLTEVIGSIYYPSLRVVIAWKTMLFMSLSVSAWVPVCANHINAHVVTWLIRETIIACHVKGVLGELLRHNYQKDPIYHGLLQAGQPSA